VSATEVIVRRGIRLEYLTITWNMLEAVIAVVSGVIAGSVALVGFGLDSVIEVSSGATLLWRLHAEHTDNRERAERLATRLVAVTFLVLAGYVGYEAATTLLRREAPERSLPGIVLAFASLIVMPLLARAKRQVAFGLKSGAMHADSRQTDICAYLSAILVGGLLLNAVWGWWWADPVAALIMVPIIATEGVHGLQGRACCEDSYRYQP
jgi:divalent metal cation (Fe/Co/Zn/Cd) transporter